MANELSPEEVHNRLVSTAAANVLWGGGKDEGTQWCAEQDLEALDLMMSQVLPLTKLGLIEKNAELQPVEVAHATKKHFETIVLATVHCPAWRLGWIKSFISLIHSHVSQTEMLHIHAIKGGPATDCEISFIEQVMPLLGFRRKSKNVWDFIEWWWVLDRPGARPFQVKLIQWKTVEKVRINFLAWSCRPVSENQNPPHLRRVAVVSCPLNGPDGRPIHDELNAKLLKGMEVIAKIAEKDGWQDNDVRCKEICAAEIAAMELE
mmetsp:Transcript_112853/g.224561  ORF Transcript_112853/g.224561 Transcript_112853/m.224561 type:complete len:263 (+) Transcript_112853:64-852(+)